MKNNIFVLIFFLLLSGCSTETVNDVDRGDHVFIEKVDLDSFMLPLLQNGSLINIDGTQNSTNEYKEYGAYIYDGRGWNAFTRNR